MWAFAQMGLARPAMARLPGCTFWKLLGVGSGEGFTPVPDTSACAILCVWDDADAALAGLAGKPFDRFARRAAESCTLSLAPVSARGRWSGKSPFLPGTDPATGPLAALTRATLRPRTMLRFWRHVPGISLRIGADPAVLFKVGVGEVPLLHQVTFSVWPDAASMARFARTSGPHAAAIEAVRAGDLFAEELYARFRVTAVGGMWHGRPLRETLT